MRHQTLFIAGLLGVFAGGAAWAQAQSQTAMAPDAGSTAQAPVAQGPVAQGPAAATPLKPGHGRGRFARMDRDGDGKVTLQEFVAFNDLIFDRIDATRSGQITKADMDAFMAKRQAEEAGRELRAKGGVGGGGGGEKMLTRISDKLAGGAVITKAQWEAMSTRRFNHLDAAHLGYLTPDTLQPQHSDAAPDA